MCFVTFFSLCVTFRPLRRKLFKPKRKTARTPEARKERDLDKYPLLDPCPPTCKRHCLEKISQERRKEIHSQYWDLNYDRRRGWIFSHVKTVEPNRRVLHPASHVTCNFTRVYTLPDSEGNEQSVCAVFFRHTLGYQHNKVINNCLSSAKPGQITTPADSRGKHAPKHKLEDDALEKIKTHIKSYHPSVSHYRREHAPLRRYLPPELTIKEMYADFQQKHPGICKRERYRKTVKMMNISFAKLGEEECEWCFEHKVHVKENHQDEADAANCEYCTEWAEHMEMAGVARAWYRKDKEKDKAPCEAVVSVDMQKVIMLPRMPGIKNCVFTRRLVQFHQTFAPLGGRARSEDKVIGAVWNEAISGRNAEDVSSAYVHYMRHPLCRDKTKFLFYMDNCTGQNKNWTIYTAMVNEVNREGGPEEIIFRYFEKGHTFMSADSFHHQVEKGMKIEKNVYDGADFERIVNQTGVAAPMEASDFIMFEHGASQGRFTTKPLLADVQEVKFVKGSVHLLWKKSMDDDDYREGIFMKKKLQERIMKDTDEETFHRQEEPRGVPQAKKDNILSNLLKFMPANRHRFWRNLSVNESSPDLIDHQ